MQLASVPRLVFAIHENSVIKMKFKLDGKNLAPHLTAATGHYLSTHTRESGLMSSLFCLQAKEVGSAERYAALLNTAQQSDYIINT